MEIAPDPAIRPSLPANHPTWFRTPIAVEKRPFWTWTGNVVLRGGPTFPTTFATPGAALEHARAASLENPGAVAVMAHEGVYYLTRLYNPEYKPFTGLFKHRSDLFESGRRLKNLSPDVFGIVDRGQAIFN